MGTSLTTALTAPLGGLAAISLKQAANFESLRVAMDNLNGSVEEGGRNFERLKEFSAMTPFQLQDLAKAQNMLQGFGLSADDAFNSLSMIGDISAITGGSIDGIGIAFGQAAAEGRLMTRDIRQLINQGVPMIKLLAETMGVAQSEVLSLAEQGEISFDLLVRSFQEATSEGGMFADGMEKQSKTIAGLFSTLKDNVSIALGEIGETLTDTFNIRGLITDLTGYIRDGISLFRSLPSETRKMAFTIAGLLGASGPVLIAIGALTTALGYISVPIMAAVAVVGSGATLLISKWGGVERYFTAGGGAEMWDDFKGIVSESITLLKDLWEAFGDDFIAITEAAFGRVEKIISFSLDKIHSLMKVFNGNFETELNIWEDNVLTTAGKIDNILTGTIMRSLFRVGEAFSNVFGEGAKESAKTTMEEWLAVEKTIQDSLFLMQDWVFPKPDTGGAKGILSDLKPDVEAVTTTTERMNQMFEDTIEKLGKMTNIELNLGPMLTHIPDQMQEIKHAAQDMAYKLVDVFDQLVWQGRRFEDVLKDITRRLINRAFTRGLTSLFTGMLTGGGGGFLSSIFSVSDALITSRGDIVKPHKDDNILMAKDFSGIGGGSMNPTDMRNAFASALQAHTSRLGPDEVWVLNQRGAQLRGRLG
ncbi:tape measure protein [Gracilimonas sp.]|uniref:tape measure protein n=1 Tax=Gracilimonas sp. TaxID=1974203 RepID=UPI0028713C1B|nr:tape measure protein [Gracilimonas sp.]